MPQWRNWLARGTYTISTEQCRGCEFEPHLGQDENPILSHLKSSPRCEFLSGYDVGNHKLDKGPIEILQDFIEFKEFKAIKNKKVESVDYEKLLALANICEDEGIKNETISYIMKSEEQRLKSFEKWPLNYIKKEDLAQCGFYYTMNKDKVICAFCKVAAFHWEETDVPIKEHFKHNRNCPLLNDIDVGNIPIKKIKFKDLLKDYEDSVPIGLYVDSDIPPANYEEGKLNDALEILLSLEKQTRTIYVEVERARLTYKLSCLKEADGNIIEAANFLQELQVETFGTMDRREKIELLLEQIRLGLAKKDYIRTQIVAKKIQIKFFEDEAQQDLKLRFYNLMIELDKIEKNYLNACKHYRAVYDTPSIQSDPAKKFEVMKNIILFIILAPYNNEQSDLINRIALEKFLEEIPSYNELLKLFNTAELINWSVLEGRNQQILRVGTPECPATSVFDNSEKGNERWNDLKNRVVEHNIRIMAKYYKRLTVKRMAELLGLSIDETEEMLTNLVVNKTIWAKVNRLEGVVNFKATKPANEIKEAVDKMVLFKMGQTRNLYVGFGDTGTAIVFAGSLAALLYRVRVKGFGKDPVSIVLKLLLGNAEKPKTWLFFYLFIKAAKLKNNKDPEMSILKHSLNTQVFLKKILNNV
ncbi:hypothetical protein RND71_043291 [Anisodus tanguticus]|uniref:PCI domain-containing protein n=1 Tax=Anisodus tanguticus TaxID=243964 RepID=A0AAE1UNF3_9SOLA|nr:hypothetical protein RND71_043291 [Anisodus tanguticus]